MKHLIAFLGYSQSRIQHPVYRQFVQAPIARRNATLLFQSRPLEERELVHEINELRRREGYQCELTFHVCATLDTPTMGQQIVQTVTLIHKLYDCPAYVYCLLPDLEHCSDEQRNHAWKCLAAINNGINDYPHLRLMTHCFLYHDTTQRSLARFLYHITREPEALDFLERYGYMGKLVTMKKSGDVSYVPEFPGIFSTFNASGITYPDGEVRYYIHQAYLNALLQMSQTQTNPIGMERCNEHVDQLLGLLPITDEKISLTSDSFIELPQMSKHRPWQPVGEYWDQCMETALKDLEDRPHEVWLNQLRNSLDVYYQTRFREMGVEYFYAQHKKLTAEYCAILLAQLREGLNQTMRSNPYPPETSVDIVRSMVNHLQQQAMCFSKAITDHRETLAGLNKSLTDTAQAWEAMGFFDRMRGKDKALLDDYKQKLARYYRLKTEIQGAEFAAKLLNELIPQVTALSDGSSHLSRLCLEALESTRNYLDNNKPEEIFDPTFDPQPIRDAATAISVDRDALIQDYAVLLRILYGLNQAGANHLALDPIDSESLLQQLRDELTERIDQRIHQRILDGTMTAVLDVSIMDRLAAIYAEDGGLEAVTTRLKEETALTLKLKGKSGRNEQYLLIAPECRDLKMSYIESDDASSVQMLHIRTGISLTDLDGFAGQRMFVEPSMF